MRIIKKMSENKLKNKFLKNSVLVLKNPFYKLNRESYIQNTLTTITRRKNVKIQTINNL